MFPGLGLHDRLGQSRLPGDQAGLPPLEPDRLRHLLVAFVLVWCIPCSGRFSLAGDCLLVAPLVTYVIFRNKQVENARASVYTGHIRYWIAQRCRARGMKIETEAESADPHERARR